MASRRPTFICAVSSAASMPSAADGRPVAHPVAAVLLEHVHGRDALPLDLLIFLRSGSRIQPLSARAATAREPNS